VFGTGLLVLSFIIVEIFFSRDGHGMKTGLNFLKNYECQPEVIDVKNRWTCKQFFVETCKCAAVTPTPSAKLAIS
jgi:hypothetical protein